MYQYIREICLLWPQKRSGKIFLIRCDYVSLPSRSQNSFFWVNIIIPLSSRRERKIGSSVRSTIWGLTKNRYRLIKQHPRRHQTRCFTPRNEEKKILALVGLWGASALVKSNIVCGYSAIRVNFQSLLLFIISFSKLTNSSVHSSGSRITLFLANYRYWQWYTRNAPYAPSYG